MQFGETRLFTAGRVHASLPATNSASLHLPKRRRGAKPQQFVQVPSGGDRCFCPPFYGAVCFFCVSGVKKKKKKKRQLKSC